MGKCQRQLEEKDGALLMRWTRVTIYTTVDGTEDELGNPVEDVEELYNGRARISPWTDESVQANGREVTKNEMQFAVPCDYEKLKNAKVLENNCKAFDITEVTELSPRWTLITAKRYST